MKNRPIKNFGELVQERKRLQSLCKTKEKEINDSFQYIHDNLGEIVLDSVSHKVLPQNDPVAENILSAGRFLESLLPEDYLKNKSLKLVLKLTQVLVGRWVYKRFKNIFN